MFSKRRVKIRHINFVISDIFLRSSKNMLGPIYILFPFSLKDMSLSCVKQGGRDTMQILIKVLYHLQFDLGVHSSGITVDLV